MNPWLIATPVVAAALASFTSYSAVNSRAQIFGPTLFQTNQAKKLALTFDDGPNPAITPKLLELLARYDAKATFFVVGKYVRECPALVREVVSRGHIVGNHTDTHPNLFFCGPGETRTELLRCSEAIHQASWLEPRWFRPPFGFRSPWVGGIAHRLNMRTVMWTLLPGDWRDQSVEWLKARMQPIADRARTAKAGVSTAAGDILCLHDGYYARQSGDRTRTLAALEFLLPRWRDAGLEFVTISQATGKAVEG
jgi:peptidoglycan-N-acetylglucosamine deacetylase